MKQFNEFFFKMSTSGTSGLDTGSGPDENVTSGRSDGNQYTGSPRKRKIEPSSPIAATYIDLNSKIHSMMHKFSTHAP